MFFLNKQTNFVLGMFSKYAYIKIYIPCKLGLTYFVSYHIQMEVNAKFKDF